MAIIMLPEHEAAVCVKSGHVNVLYQALDKC